MCCMRQVLCDCGHIGETEMFLTPVSVMAGVAHLMALRDNGSSSAGTICHQLTICLE